MSTYGVCSKTPNRWEFLNGCLINSAWICCKNKDFVWEEPVYWDEARRSWRSSFKLLVSLCFSTYTVPPLHFLAFFFGSTEIFASNKKTDTNCSKEAILYQVASFLHTFIIVHVKAIDWSVTVDPSDKLSSSGAGPLSDRAGLLTCFLTMQAGLLTRFLTQRAPDRF